MSAAGQRARRRLLDVFHAALQRVDGRAAVRAALTSVPTRDCAVLAVGKAAEAMLEGARDALGERLGAGLLISKPGHLDPAKWRDTQVECLVSAHPVPDARSLAAGRAVLGFLEALPDREPLLVLISGGASALVEVPRPGVSLEDLVRANAWLLSSGLSIGAVNRVRRGLSAIKAGGLLAYLGDRPVRGLLISDVPGDDPAVIGSGLLVPATASDRPELPEWLGSLLAVAAPEIPSRPPPELQLVATLDDALVAAAARARALGLPVRRHAEFLEGDAAQQGVELGAYLCDAAAPGVHLWGGETTVTLPATPGRGGRNQHLALALAGRCAGRDDLWCLAAGTDGTDGPTEDAGGLVDGATWRRARDAGVDPAAALARADAGRALEAAGDLVHTGPTGTNVMDLVIALKGEPGLTAEAPG